jgi:hypothetical protein
MPFITITGRTHHQGTRRHLARERRPGDRAAHDGRRYDPTQSGSGECGDGYGDPDRDAAVFHTPLKQEAEAMNVEWPENWVAGIEENCLLVC